MYSNALYEHIGKNVKLLKLSKIKRVGNTTLFYYIIKKKTPLSVLLIF